MVPWESLGDLARDPLRSRVSRHAKRQPNSSSMPYDDKTIEDPERDRWKDKKVDRRDAVGMVAQKRAPALRWWPRLAAHIPSDCRLSDLEAELEQFTMNVWGAPERVRPAHLANCQHGCAIQKYRIDRDHISCCAFAGTRNRWRTLESGKVGQPQLTGRRFGVGARLQLSIAWNEFGSLPRERDSLRHCRQIDGEHKCGHKEELCTDLPQR